MDLVRVEGEMPNVDNLLLMVSEVLSRWEPPRFLQYNLERP